jgi:hypothetical protein
MRFALKQGDTENAIQAVLRSRNTGAAIDLTDVSAVAFEMYKTDGTALVSGAGSVVSETGGTIKYEWAAGDTDTVGTHNARFLLSWSGGGEESFPARGWIKVAIESVP